MVPRLPSRPGTTVLPKSRPSCQVQGSHHGGGDFEAEGTVHGGVAVSRAHGSADLGQPVRQHFQIRGQERVRARGAVQLLPLPAQRRQSMHPPSRGRLNLWRGLPSGLAQESVFAQARHQSVAVPPCGA
jgi:hypothetical protein